MTLLVFKQLYLSNDCLVIKHENMFLNKRTESDLHLEVWLLSAGCKEPVASKMGNTVRAEVCWPSTNARWEVERVWKEFKPKQSIPVWITTAGVIFWYWMDFPGFKCELRGKNSMGYKRVSLRFSQSLTSAILHHAEKSLKDFLKITYLAILHFPACAMIPSPLSFSLGEWILGSGVWSIILRRTTPKSPVSASRNCRCYGCIPVHSAHAPPSSPSSVAPPICCTGEGGIATLGLWGWLCTQYLTLVQFTSCRCSQPRGEEWGT